MNNEMLPISRRMPQTKAKKLRRQGYIPGVLYGYKQDTLPVLFDKKRVEYFITHMNGNALFEISLDGALRPVRIREIQRDPVTQEIIHLDLQNVHMDRVIQMEVPLRFEGIHEVERRGLILQHQRNTALVEGLAKDIPAHIKVPVHLMQNRHSIRISDLELAAELSFVDPPDELIAMMVKPTREIPDEEEKETSEEQTQNERKAEA